MAVNWMDNFSIYGSGSAGAARLLNGAYAEGEYDDIRADPDPVAAAAGSLVLYFSTTTGGIGVLRKVLLAQRTTVGIAARFWQTQLPEVSGMSARFASLRDVNNVEHLYLDCDASGNIRVMRCDQAGDVQIGITSSPVIVANAWQHVETKIFLDPAVGTVEVRVEGATVLTVAATRTTTDKVGANPNAWNAAVGGRNGSTNIKTYVKDLLIWDNTGAFNNNFMGLCKIYKVVPDGDVALNWTPQPNDGIGWNKINEDTPDDDVEYIAAPTPAPAAYKCTLTDLPPDITVVKSVMSLHRTRKTDGGDGSVQTGLISGASTGLGADRPMTTAYTYWSDVYDADPNGSVAWTRTAVNALQMQINRTL